MKSDLVEVHPIARTPKYRSTYFALLSRAGGAVTATLLALHMEPQYVVFLLLDSPDAAAKLTGLPPCRRNKFIEDFLSTHADDLRSPEALARLRTAAMFARLDIASLEVGHGRLRRRVLEASTNTWKMLIEDASCGWVLQEWQRYWREVQLLAGDNLGIPRSTGNRKSAKGAGNPRRCKKGSTGVIRKDWKQRSGGGGMYRAYLSENRGCMFVKGAAAAYHEAKRNMSVAELDRLKAKGKALSLAHTARVQRGLPRLS